MKKASGVGMAWVWWVAFPKCSVQRGAARPLGSRPLWIFLEAANAMHELLGPHPIHTTLHHHRPAPPTPRTTTRRSRCRAPRGVAFISPPLAHSQTHPLHNPTPIRHTGPRPTVYKTKNPLPTAPHTKAAARFPHLLSSRQSHPAGAPSLLAPAQAVRRTTRTPPRKGESSHPKRRVPRQAFVSFLISGPVLLHLSIASATHDATTTTSTNQPRKRRAAAVVSLYLFFVCDCVSPRRGAFDR